MRRLFRAVECLVGTRVPCLLKADDLVAFSSFYDLRGDPFKGPWVVETQSESIFSLDLDVVSSVIRFLLRAPSLEV